MSIIIWGVPLHSIDSTNYVIKFNYENGRRMYKLETLFSGGVYLEDKFGTVVSKLNHNSLFKSLFKRRFW